MAGRDSYDDDLRAEVEALRLEVARLKANPRIAKLIDNPHGWAVVPFDCPDYAVEEVMQWTHCKCPNMAWEAINCALSLMDVVTGQRLEGVKAKLLAQYEARDNT